jgi:hypothetical protein
VVGEGLPPRLMVSVESSSFHDRFAKLRPTILRDEAYGHWFNGKMGHPIATATTFRPMRRVEGTVRPSLVIAPRTPPAPSSDVAGRR